MAICSVLGPTQFFSSPVSHTFSSSKHILNLKPSSLFFKPHSRNLSSPLSTRIMASTQTIEHVVLLKVKENTDPSNVNAMVNGLNGLSSLDPVLHLSAGPILRYRSSSFNFTHILHSRYNSKEDLNAYSQHPNHVGVAKELVFPICEDIMAVDWVAENLDGQVSPTPGSALQFTFLKLKENVGEETQLGILGVIKGIKDSFGQIHQLTCGENFSPGRAKGFSIASVAVFPGVGELEAVDSNLELENFQKEKVREFLEGVIVVDYTVPLPQSSSL
ncbi:hypothetical protein UlMin_021303 [Ulmus minor]